MILDQNHSTQTPGVISFPDWVYSSQQINPPDQPLGPGGGPASNVINILGTIGKFINPPTNVTKLGS